MHRYRVIFLDAASPDMSGLAAPDITPSTFSRYLVESLGCPCLEFHRAESMQSILKTYRMYQEFGKDDGFLPLLMLSEPLEGEKSGPEETRKSITDAAKEAADLDVSAWIHNKINSYPERELADYKRDEGLGISAGGMSDITFWLTGPCEPASKIPPDSPNVILACIPETRPWTLPFWITPCGGGDTPSMVEQMAFFRRWHEAYGAVPATVSAYSWSLIVAHPPKTLDDAMTLAWEHFAFSPDCLLEMGLEPYTIRAIAEQLLGATVWHFWWD